MISTKSIMKLEKIANLAVLCGIIFVLLLTWIFQFAWHELPCPLCLLQRFGWMGMALGLLFNMQFGFRPSHYSMVLISSLFTGFVSLRQIALHIIPGIDAYGSAIFGLHLYTWSFVGSMLVTMVVIFLLGVDRQYQKSSSSSRPWQRLVYILFIILGIIILANIFSVIVECGFKECIENPTYYELIKQYLEK